MMKRLGCGIKMRKGARIQKGFLLINKFKKCKKCVVCGKAVRTENKTSLCSIHYYMEYRLNTIHQKMRSQGFGIKSQQVKRVCSSSMSSKDYVYWLRIREQYSNFITQYSYHVWSLSTIDNFTHNFYVAFITVSLRCFWLVSIDYHLLFSCYLA